MSLLYIVLVLLVAGLLLWGIKTVMGAPGMTLAEPFRTIIYVVVVLAICFFVIQAFFGFVPGMPTMRVR